MDYNEVDSNMGCTGHGNQDDCYGILYGFIWCSLIIGAYWLCCSILGVSIKPILLQIPDYENEWIMMILIVYWIVFTAIIEEWFW